jgi:hypothetical protein
MTLNRFVGRMCAMGVWMLMAMSGLGCQVPSALWYKVAGPPPIPPKYIFPQKPLLLLVENSHSSSVAIPEADELSRVVYDDLVEHKVAPMIDPAKVQRLRDEDAPAFGKMSISRCFTCTWISLTLKCRRGVIWCG